jgi:hypothetical protein
MTRHKTKTCTNHCRTCGRHFASTAAFDKHRVGIIGGEGFAGRQCIDPMSVTRDDGEHWFRETIGDCRISGSVPSILVPVLGEAAAVDRFATVRKAA